MPDAPDLTPQGYPDLLTELAQITHRFLIESGIDGARASEIAFGLSERVREDFGGQLVYIPIGKIFEISAMHREIAEQCDGKNFSALARRYRLAERSIRRIVKAVTGRAGGSA